MHAQTDSTSFNPLKTLRIVWRVLCVILLGMSAIMLWQLFQAETPPGSPDRLPVHQTVPDFQLVERSGQQFARQGLANHIWVANFVFTRCPGVCPLLSARMSKLQTALEGAHQTSVRLLSFSVDPEWDTPERLKSYADQYSADPTRWLFLTGDFDAVQHLVKKGFQLAMMNEMNEMNGMNTVAEGSHNSGQQKNQSNAQEKNALEQIVHSDRFVLIDPEFRIRAYYRGNAEDLIAQVLHDVDILQQEYDLIL